MTLLIYPSDFEVREDQDENDRYPDELYYAVNICETGGGGFNITEIIRWCYENIDSGFQLIDQTHGSLIIIFTNNSAATAFKLKWTK